MANVKPPVPFGGNSNYFLNAPSPTGPGVCFNLLGVEVKIKVKTDIVASNGFSFQLNCYSPKSELCVVQQYVIAVDNSGEMSCIVTNWQNVTTWIINNWVVLYDLASPVLPVGYLCTIALGNDSSGNITSATFTVSADISPALDTALSSFGSDLERVYYIDTVGHVHQLLFKLLLSGTPKWIDQDLTAWTVGTLAAKGTTLSSFYDTYGEHVYFIGADDHVHQFYFSDPNWVDQDLTAGSKGINPAKRTALSSFADSYGEHVYFIGTDDHVHQLYFNNPNWEDQDLTVGSKGINSATDTALSSFADGYGEHVCFIGTDSHVHQLYFNNPNWVDQDLTIGGGGITPAKGTALSSFADSYGEHVCYIGTDGHVHQLYFNNPNWVDQDLTIGGGGITPAKDTALSTFSDSYGEHVCYIGTDGHVHQLYFNNPNWVDQDLTVGSKAISPAKDTALSTFSDIYGEHVYFIGTDGRVHQLYFSAPDWVDQDLTTATTGVLASFTQTLLSSGESTSDLSPIVALELDFVGYANGQSTTLSSASGTFTYTATTPMTVQNSEPGCCEFPGGTKEYSNAGYGQLPQGSSTSFVQTFNVLQTLINDVKVNGLIKTPPPHFTTGT